MAKQAICRCGARVTANDDEQLKAVKAEHVLLAHNGIGGGQLAPFGLSERPNRPNRFNRPKRKG